MASLPTLHSQIHLHAPISTKSHFQILELLGRPVAWRMKLGVIAEEEKSG